MRKRTYMEVTSLIVFLSIITIILQFISYYFFASIYIVLGIACFVSIICSHILQEKSQTYQASFIYTLLTTFISAIIMVLTYVGKDHDYIPYSNILIGIVAINWFAPMVHGFIRNMFDSGTRVKDYPSFFKNNSILFLLFYLAILFYGSFASTAFPWAYRIMTDQPNFTPFWLLATQIEDYLNKMIPLTDIVIYLGIRIIIFIPYGYYSFLLLRRKPRFAKYITLLILPLIIEIVQYFVIPTRCDLDELTYGLIGGLLGGLLFYLSNSIHRAISGKDFLEKASDYRYSNHSLHF